MNVDPKQYAVVPGSSIEGVDLDEEPLVRKNGETLDEAGAEREGEDAVQAFRRRGLSPGRKSLSGGGAHSPRVQYRVPESVLRRAIERAEREGLPSVHALARKALEEYLAS
jgi:hypothetical protein